MERSRCSSCDFSFLSDRLTLDLHRFDEIGGRCSFERQSVANFPHNTLFQGLNKVYASVAARHFRSFQVQLCQFPAPAERFTVRHNLANHSPFVCSARRQRLWVQQECLCSSCSNAITPGSKNSIARHNASGEVRNIVEGRTLAATITLATNAYSEWTWARPSIAAIIGTRMLAMFSKIRTPSS